MKRIAILVQLPREVSPGQRFRIEQFEPLLQANGFQIETFPFLDQAAYSILYQPGHLFSKIIGVCKGFGRRLRFLTIARQFDYIFLQREMAPVGPPVFEWILAKILRVKIVYDYDDAIWVPNVSKSNRLAGFVKCFWKVKWICRWAYKVSAGNQYLADYARKYNSNVVINPTCVDTDNKYLPVPSLRKQPPTIGWTGSHSTVPFLYLGRPALKELEQRSNFCFVAICDKEPQMGLNCQRFIQWNKHTEIGDLAQIDIGIMPLEQDAWSEGKCGFKLIQYMAMGIPALASPVGVNKQIIDHGVNGYLCSTTEEWVSRLHELLNDEEKCREMGVNGRRKIVEQYSIRAVSNTFLSLFS